MSERLDVREYVKVHIEANKTYNLIKLHTHGLLNFKSMELEIYASFPLIAGAVEILVYFADKILNDFQRYHHDDEIKTERWGTFVFRQCSHDMLTLVPVIPEHLDYDIDLRL